MARIRTLKPEIWQDEALGTVSVEAQCLFVGLITQADDHGRLEGGAARMRALIWPYKPEIPVEHVEEWLNELQSSALVQRYTIAGRQYVALPGWHLNQKVDRPSDSKIPPPPDDADVVLANPREGSRIIALDQGPGIKDQGSGPDEDSLRSSSGGSDRDLICELFAYWQERCGHPNAQLSPERRRKIVARLREGITPQQVREAIDGAAVGAAVKGKKRFDDIELICRSAAKLESFIGREGPPADDTVRRLPVRPESPSEMLRALDGVA